MIARARATLRWIDSLAEPGRTLAIFGVPEAEWAAYTAWIAEAVAVIRGETKRVWHPNPAFMEPGEPIGHWTTEKAR